jgi:hypothetical protein
MTPQGKTWVTRAFEALGPERVARGLEAVGHTWNDRFLAIAVSGERGAFVRELAQDRRTDPEHFASTLVGVPHEAVRKAVGLWDRDESEFRALAAEWLEANPTAAPAAPVCAARAGDGAGDEAHERLRLRAHGGGKIPARLGGIASARGRQVGRGVLGPARCHRTCGSA